MRKIAERFGDRATHQYDLGYRDPRDRLEGVVFKLHLRDPPEPTFAERLVAFKAARASASTQEN